MPTPADGGVGTGGGRLTAIGTGSATTADPTPYARNGPSFFADPTAWLVTGAAQAALAACADEPLQHPDQVGVVALSSRCTAGSMGAIARSAPGGLVSPLRFAGANPGVLAGLPCIRWRLRGPTLTFAMEPGAGVAAATAVVAAWVRSGQADHVLVVAHVVVDQQETARCVILRAAHPGEPDATVALDWLIGDPTGRTTAAEPAPAPEPAPVTTARGHR